MPCGRFRRGVGAGGVGAGGGGMCPFCPSLGSGTGSISNIIIFGKDRRNSLVSVYSV